MLLTMGGTIEDYNSSKIDEIAFDLASKLGLLASSIDVSLQPGSVVLRVTVPGTHSGAVQVGGQSIGWHGGPP